MMISIKTLKMTGASIVVVLIIGISFIMNFMKSIEYQSQVSAISFVNVYINDVRDGTYTGESDVNILYAKAEGIVQRGAITNVNFLEHRSGIGLAVEKIVNEIAAEQMVDVDTVSSATHSNIVIRKAVENALMFGVQ